MRRDICRLRLSSFATEADNANIRVACEAEFNIFKCSCHGPNTRKGEITYKANGGLEGAEHLQDVQHMFESPLHNHHTAQDIIYEYGGCHVPVMNNWSLQHNLFLEVFSIPQAGIPNIEGSVHTADQQTDNAASTYRRSKDKYKGIRIHLESEATD